MLTASNKHDMETPNLIIQSDWTLYVFQNLEIDLATNSPLIIPMKSLSKRHHANGRSQ